MSIQEVNPRLYQPSLTEASATSHLLSRAQKIIVTFFVLLFYFFFVETCRSLASFTKDFEVLKKIMWGIKLSEKLPDLKVSEATLGEI